MRFNSSKSELYDETFVKGFEFEFSIATQLSRIPNLTVITNFDSYSPRLKRFTATDVLAFIGQEIIVIEAKRFMTSLEGSFSDKSWTGTSGRRSYHIFNPIYQNYEHIRSIQGLFRRKGLDVGEFCWHNFVTVPDQCKILADKKYIKTESSVVRSVVSISRGKERNEKVFRYINGESVIV